MVVKSVRGRRRYVAFKVDAELTREALISKLCALKGDDAPYVVQCAEGWAVIRSTPDDVCNDIDTLRLADESAVPIKTSGTLRTLRDKYEVLKRTKVPARK